MISETVIPWLCTLLNQLRPNNALVIIIPVNKCGRNHPIFKSLNTFPSLEVVGSVPFFQRVLQTFFLLLLSMSSLLVPFCPLSTHLKIQFYFHRAYLLLLTHAQTISVHLPLFSLYTIKPSIVINLLLFFCPSASLHT